MVIPHFVYQVKDIWIVFLVAVVNSTAMHICEQVFVSTPIFNSLGFIPVNRIAGSYGHSVFNL